VPVRILYLVSHPIQYQAPLLRRIAADPDLELLVLFEDMSTAASYVDPGFRQAVTWDIPLTDGYKHVTLSSVQDLQQHLTSADVLWVHGWDSRVKRNAIRLAARVGVPVLMRGENTDAAMPDGGWLRGPLKRAYLRSIFRCCSGFLCVGSDNRQYYLNHGVEPVRLFSMPYAVDNEFFRQRAEQARQARPKLQKELGLQPGRPVVLFAGKMQSRKHPEALLAAFRELDTVSCGCPYLLFVGDGDQRARLQEQGRTMGDQVRFLGFRNQTELPALYDLADLFVLASAREPWGLAINEAMNGATAIIASTECGCAADLIDSNNGRVVVPGDTDALRHALSVMLVDRAGLRRAGQNSAQRISTWGLAQSHEGLRTALTRLTLLPA